jgi:hypothetical protein
VDGTSDPAMHGTAIGLQHAVRAGSRGPSA